MTDGTTEQTDAEAAVERIRERGRTVARRECERALRRLRAKQDLSEREERAVRELAETLAAELLAVPESHLREADEETAEAVLELFAD